MSYWIPVSLLRKDIDQIKDEENLSFVSCHSRLAFTVICLRLKKFCFPSETQMFCKLTNFYVSSPSHTKLFSKQEKNSNSYRVIVKEGHKVKCYYTAKIWIFEPEKMFLQTKNSEHLIIYIELLQYFLLISIFDLTI